jgi:hypothetical protein
MEETIACRASGIDSHSLWIGKPESLRSEPFDDTKLQTLLNVSELTVAVWLFLTLPLLLNQMQR